MLNSSIFAVLDGGRDLTLALKNPKPHSDGSTRWYPYYAGYSEGFLKSLLKGLALPGGSVVLDPWNGSGTTTVVAKRQGYNVAGFDINPALVIVAKARLLDRTTASSLRSIAEEIVSNADKLELDGNEADSLRQWFSSRAAAYIRALEQATYLLLVDHRKYARLYDRTSLVEVSSLAAFFYVALFCAVREQLASFRGSNPAWITTAKTKDELVRVQRRTMRASFIRQVKKLTKRLRLESTDCKAEPSNEPQLDVGDSLGLPLDDDSVDAVITSPPYCTRIDYVVAALPELAVLGSPCRAELKSLRDRMLGTPTISGGHDGFDASISPTAAEFIENVEAHESKASATYYSRHFRQYFASLEASLKELDRTLKPGGSATLVVQDSYYKEVHNDLPAVTQEHGVSLGWRLTASEKFEIGNPLRVIHTGSRTTMRPTHATECVLVFEKG